MVAFNVAKRNEALPPVVRAKSPVVLKTCPVGFPPGTTTLGPCLTPLLS
jgi:hypothetical protein